jgi:flagella basal body P-ring formation protein FlgA
MPRLIELSMLIRLCAFALGASLVAPLSRAETPAEAPAAQAVRLFLERETTGLPGRVAIEFGRLDPQARPAPCARVEPFLPAGARLWGRTSLGLRCSDGTAWSAFLPVTIRVFAPALVAERSLPAGHALTETDYRIEETDLAQQPAGIVQDARFAADKVLSRPVAAGQPLRREYFRARPLMTPGDPVLLVYEGSGFNVSTEAKALGSATIGEAVRIQTESGRIVTGIVVGPRRVELRP